MAKDKEIFENEIKEYVRKRNEEIVDAFCDKHTELHEKHKKLNGEKIDMIKLARESQLAMGKTLEETRDMLLLLFGSIPSYLRPFYFWNLKQLMKGMGTQGLDQEFFNKTIEILDEAFGAEVISFPSRRDK